MRVNTFSKKFQWVFSTSSGDGKILYHLTKEPCFFFLLLTTEFLGVWKFCGFDTLRVGGEVTWWWMMKKGGWVKKSPKMDYVICRWPQFIFFGIWYITSNSSRGQKCKQAPTVYLYLSWWYIIKGGRYPIGIDKATIWLCFPGIAPNPISKNCTSLFPARTKFFPISFEKA